MNPGSSSGASTRHLLLAFAAVYLVWGSTYLAIRFGVETIPPFILGGTRFLIAGLILAVVSRVRGAPAPKPAEWKAATISGVFMVVGGNGLVCWAELYVPSGLAALLVATVPLWLVAIARLGPDREVARPLEVLGLVFGLAGVVVLVGGSNEEIGVGDATSNQVLVGALVILVASLSWAVGSMYNRRAALPSPPLYGTGLTMIAGGAVLLLVALGAGEFGRFSPADVSVRSWWSLAYLTLFGSIVAFSAYMWLLRNVRPAAAGTYAYVNPVVALFLGWWLAGEAFTPPMLAGSVIIVAAVVLVQRGRAPKGGPRPATVRAPASR
ncbi:drug/metabolite exporter YedA [Candidatus Palauibacter sp.]|uniref:drug/metabolite exporter YedA n=1 Tax=Candidatus Palauibacter sp. TaxID=3101350 RepID=UPI003B01016E